MLLLVGRGVCRSTARSQLFSNFRQYASQAPPARPPGRPDPFKSSRATAAPQMSQTSNSKTRSMNLARAIFESGTINIFKAPHRLVHFRAQSYILAGLCVFGVTTYRAQGLLDMDKIRERGLHPAVGVSYIAITMVLVGFACIAIYRTGGHIKSLDLVQKSGLIFMEASVTRMAPFLPAEKILIKPFDLQISNRVVQLAGRTNPFREVDVNLDRVLDARGVGPAVGSIIGRFFYGLFSSARQFFAQDGQLACTIVQDVKGTETATRGYSLDQAGTYYFEPESSETDMPAVIKMATFVKS